MLSPVVKNGLVSFSFIILNEKQDKRSTRSAYMVQSFIKFNTYYLQTYRAHTRGPVGPKNKKYCFRFIGRICFYLLKTSLEISMTRILKHSR